MRAYWESGGKLHSFLTSAPDGGEWSPSNPGRFTYGYHCIGGWIGHRADLDAMAKRKTSAPAGDRTAVVQLVLLLY